MFYPLLLTQNVHILIVFLSVKLIIMKIKEWDHSSLTSKILRVGGVLKSSEPADLITDPGFENCPRFVVVIDQNKI